MAYARSAYGRLPYTRLPFVASSTPPAVTWIDTPVSVLPIARRLLPQALGDIIFVQPAQTPAQLGFLWNPQFPVRARAVNPPADQPREQYFFTAALTPGPSGWDVAPMFPMRRTFAPFTPAVDVVQFVVSVVQAAIQYIGPVWKRRRNRPET